MTKRKAEDQQGAIWTAPQKQKTDFTEKNHAVIGKKFAKAILYLRVNLSSEDDYSYIWDFKKKIDSKEFSTAFFSSCNVENMNHLLARCIGVKRENLLPYFKFLELNEDAKENFHNQFTNHLADKANFNDPHRPALNAKYDLAFDEFRHTSSHASWGDAKKDASDRARAAMLAAELRRREPSMEPFGLT
jgi:hypothetical protein